MKPAWNIETQAIQGGYDPKPGDPRVVTICQSTTFKYDNAERKKILCGLCGILG